MVRLFSTSILFFLIFLSVAVATPVIYSVEYGPRPSSPPSLKPIFYGSYRGFVNVYVVLDNWYFASRARADSCQADAFVIPGGNTSDVPFYDGSLDSYVQLLQNPGRPTMGYCAGLQFLAMARGAGEVAPLMLVGAVKLAPELPLDMTYPFLHGNRSFMHLGFHIFDVGFQSQNSEAAKPMVYTTTLLLIVIITVLNLLAVWLRAYLRKRFVAGQF